MTRTDRGSDVVVVGGGIRGLCIAYFLARGGVGVTLVEKGFLGSGASGANAGLVNVSQKTPGHYTLWSLLSADMYPEFVAELEAEVDYQRDGYLRVAETEVEAEDVIERAQKQSRVPGVKVEILDARRARALEPALSPRIVAASFCAQDGNVDPLKLVRAVGRAARRLGAHILHHREVTGIRLANGRVAAVITKEGEVAADVVVDAAGIFVPEVARMVGVRVPILPQRGQMFQLEALPPLLNRPVQALRQLRSGTIMVGTTNEFVGHDRRVTYEAGTDLLARARRLVPALAGARVIRGWAGLRPMPPDGLPVYDAVPEVPGFFVAVGHSGITLAPITGQVFLDLITKGRTDLPVTPYSLSRFNDADFEWTRAPIKGAARH
ncbi:MAG TPA: FAD-dependent oxidoreductase [Candidatus Methylomirabilis sp.]|nr:FAD-dependent oxidoreductase [Candidatus Methylomirabilis sp.]